MLNVPIWFFVILCVLGFVGAITIIMLILACIGGITTEISKNKKYEKRLKESRELIIPDKE